MAQRNPSKITTEYAVDDALVQDARFEFDADERQYLDNQIRGTQQRVVDLKAQVDGAGASSAPAGTCTLEQFGAVGDDTADDSAALTAARDAILAGTYRVLTLGAKTYKIVSTPTDFDGISKMAIRGQGPGSVLHFTGATAGVTACLRFMNSDAVSIRDFVVQGDGATSQRGILSGSGASDAPQIFNSDGVIVRDCLLSGIHTTNAPVPTSQVANLVGTRVYDCGTGIVGGAQMALANCNVSGCTIGLEQSAGNLSAVGCVISENVTGVQLQPSGNDGHGHFSGCTINHNSTNLDCQAIANGMTFTGGHMYAGAITIAGNAGLLEFNGGMSIQPTSLSITGAATVRFADVMVSTAVLASEPTIAATAYVECLNVRDLDGSIPLFAASRSQVLFTFAADANETMSRRDSAARHIHVADGVTSVKRVITIDALPMASSSKIFANHNTYDVDVQWSTGAAVTVATGKACLLGADGTDAIVELLGDAGAEPAGGGGGGAGLSAMVLSLYVPTSYSNAATPNWLGAASAGPSLGRDIVKFSTAPADGTPVGGVTPPDFAGANWLWSTPEVLDDFVGTQSNAGSAGSFALLINATAASAPDANSYNNPGLLTSHGSSNFALTFSTSGVHCGINDTAFKEIAPIACTTGALHLIIVTFDGTTLKVYLDSAAAVTVLAGLPLTGVSPGRELKVGTNYNQTAHFDGRIWQPMAAAIAWDAGQIAAIKADINATYGTAFA